MTSVSSISVDSGLDILTRQARDVQAAVEALLEHSAVRYEDINASSGAFFVGWNVWQWQPLPDEAQPLVGAARRAHDELCSFAETIFQAGAPDRGDAVEQLSGWLPCLIEQPNRSVPNGAPGSSIAEIIERVVPGLEKFLPQTSACWSSTPVPCSTARNSKTGRSTVARGRSFSSRKCSPSSTSESATLAPPKPPRRSYAKSTSSTAAVTPSVGVLFVGKLRVREVARSPDMATTFPWLRLDTPDDLIIAAAPELLVRDLRGWVAVLASDRNKARLAGLATVATSQL